MVDRLAAIERVMALRQDVERGHIRGHRLRYRVLAPDPRGREHKFGLITFVFNPYSDTISAYRSVFRQPMAPGMLTLSTEDGSPTFFQSTDMAGMGGSIADSYIFHSWAGGGKFCIRTRRNRDNLPAKGTLRAGHTLEFTAGPLKGSEFKVETIDRTTETICLSGTVRRRDWNQIVWEKPATFAGVDLGPAQTGKVEYTTGKIGRGSGHIYNGPNDFTFHSGYLSRFPGNLRIDTQNRRRIRLTVIEATLGGWRIEPATLLDNGWLRILANDGKMLWQAPMSTDKTTPYQYVYTDARDAIRAESQITVQIVTGVTIPTPTRFAGFSWTVPDVPDPPPPPTDAKSLGLALALGKPISQGDGGARELGIGLRPGQPAQDGEATPNDLHVGVGLGQPGQDGTITPRELEAGIALGQAAAVRREAPEFFASQTAIQIYDDQIAAAVDGWLADMHATAGSGFTHPRPQQAPQPDPPPAPSRGF